MWSIRKNGFEPEYKTPEIIEAIDAYLKGGNTADKKFSQTEKTALDYLSKELEESADHLMRNGEDVDDIYSTLDWTSVADTFPEKFDLRDRGTVTPVKSQTPWGTCWSFATIAASETSLLNSLGLTAEEYKEKFGEEMDLSEKHLASPRMHFLNWMHIRKENILMMKHRPAKDFIRLKTPILIPSIMAETISCLQPVLLPVSAS